MSMLVIRTQVYENYAWREDGTLGVGDEAYWKPKGGSEYKVLNVPLNVDYAEIVTAAKVEQSNDGFQEFIIDWSIEADDYLSEFEKNQLEFEGSIRYAEPSMEYSDIVLETV
jgi:hypothetical protein